jgi:replicative DNA helicase
MRWFPAYTKVGAIRALLYKIKFTQGVEPGLLVIDNANDLAPSRKGYNDTNSYEEKGEVFSELKTLAHDFDIAIWADSQTNRGASKAELVGVESIADSVKKAFKADIILALNQDMQEFQNDTMRLYIAKARRYSKRERIVKVKVNYSTMTIEQIDDTE